MNNQREGDRTPRESVAIQSVFLHVTKACNLNCRYCYFSARLPMADEMSRIEFAHLWPEIVEVSPEKVIFTGGEPLLRPDLQWLLADLADADPNHRIQRCLNTNGHLVTQSLALQLVGLVDEVRVSLDALEARNDAMRGAGNFQAVLRSLDHLQEAGFEPKVLITLTADCLPDLEELLCLLFERNLTRVNMNGFRPIGRGQDRWEWRADPALVRTAVDSAIEKCFPQAMPPPTLSEAEAEAHCGVGHFLNILPNGDVYPCHVLTSPEFKCGNVREASLLEICQSQGLLGQLTSLDFRTLASADQQLLPLVQNKECLGNVYARTRSAAIWRESLPILP